MPRKKLIKNCLIVGGAGTIGRGIISSMLKAEYDVTVADYSEKRMNEITSLYKPHLITTIKVDLENEESISNMITTFIKKKEYLNVLINTARPALRIDKLENTMIEWDYAHKILLKGPVVTILKAKKFLAKTKGCVVNIGSTNSQFISHQPLSYHAFKAGLDHVTRYLAKNFAAKGIRVNCVSPGLVENNKYPDRNNKTKTKSIEVSIPIQRKTFPEEIGNLVLFLASDEASSITGQVMNIDGGITVVDHFDIAKRMES